MEIISLKNGLKIVFDENEHMRSAAVNIYIGCGSRYEPEKYAGVSHFIEHMLFKGTTHRSCTDIAEQMDEIGGRLNAFTTKEYTCVYTQALSCHIETALEIVLDMLLYSSFKEADINTEKGVICEEIGMYEDSPEDVCFDLMCSGIWPKSSLGRPIIGNRVSVNSLSRDDITNFMKKYYTPDNMTIAVSGRFDKDRVYKIIEKALGTLRHEDNEFKENDISQHKLSSFSVPKLGSIGNTNIMGQIAENTVQPSLCLDGLDIMPYKSGDISVQNCTLADLCKNAAQHLLSDYAITAKSSDVFPKFHSSISLYNHDFEQTNLIIAFPGLQVNDEARYAAALMSSIAGASSSSRLNRRIREELGMAYSIYSFHTSHIGAGVFGVSAGVSHDNQGRVIDESLKILLTLKSSITEAELTRSKQQLKSSIAMSLESTSARSSSFGPSLLIDGCGEDEDIVMSKIDAVTLQQIKLIADRIIDINKIHIAVAGQAESEGFYKKIIEKAYKYNY